jgi:hypothetical protein
MSLKVIGAGLGRTSTNSLRVALERLLGSPCHHMFEVMEHPEQVPGWQRAADGEEVDWPSMYCGYAAAVDWPTAAYWKELGEVFPQAIILLSTRDPEKWWKSASETIFPSIMRTDDEPQHNARREMIRTMLARTFSDDLTDKDKCVAAFLAHNDEVRRSVPADKLVEWKVEEGWAPLCNALGVPIPEEPFPRTNDKAGFQEKILGRT